MIMNKKNLEVKKLLDRYNLVSIDVASWIFEDSIKENIVNTDNAKSWWIIDIMCSDYRFDQLLKLVPMTYNSTIDSYIVGIDWADRNTHPLTGDNLNRKPPKINGDTATIQDLLNGLDIVYIPSDCSTQPGFDDNWFLSNMDEEQADIVSQFLPVKYNPIAELYMFGTGELHNNGYPVMAAKLKKRDNK